MAGKGKCMGGKRVAARHLSSNELYINKLNQLSRACGHDPASLAYKIICAALDSIAFVYSLQKSYTKEGRLWLTLERLSDGKVEYKIEGEQDFIRKASDIRKSKYLNFRRDKRITISYSNEYEKKLSLLAESCSCKFAHMAAFLLHFGLDSDQVLMQFQDRYCTRKHLRVTPVEENGVVTYMFMEKVG